MKTKKEDDFHSEKYSQLEFLVKAKQHNRILLLTKPNVIGMGVGSRIRDGVTTDELVVKVYVSTKMPKDQLSKEDLIPPVIYLNNKKVKTDVEESRMPQAAQLVLRFRPLMGGSSISPAVGGTGTLGVCITDDNDRTFILSCNHVLRATGNRIMQPGTLDGGTAPADNVATVTACPPIDFASTTIRLPWGPVTFPNLNRVDCALARVDNNFNGGNREIYWIGYPSFNTTPAIAFPPFFNMTVCKMGRTTGYTTGKIVDIASDFFVDYSAMFGNPPGTNTAFFVDQIKVDGGSRAFADRGDSGSLLLDTDSHPVGLVFASDLVRFGFCNHIGDVMSALSILRI